MSEGKLSHIAEDGKASMVDVSAKEIVPREALARGFVRLQEETVRLIREDGIAKGNVLTVAQIAGVQAAKQTQHLIPLCHQLPLNHVSVEFEFVEGGIEVSCRTRTSARTGVEMESLTGVSVAALTIYDMCKAVDKTMAIEAIRLVEKRKGEAEAG